LQILDALYIEPLFHEIFLCFSEKAAVPQRQLDVKKKDKKRFQEGVPDFENEQSD